MIKSLINYKCDRGLRSLFFVCRDCLGWFTCQAVLPKSFSGLYLCCPLCIWEDKIWNKEKLALMGVVQIYEE